MTPLLLKPTGGNRRLLIYLDQNVVSDVAKLATTRSADSDRTATLTRLRDALSAAIWKARTVICPESLYHREESNAVVASPEGIHAGGAESPLFDSLGETIQRLSLGLHFIDMGSMLEHQVLWILGQRAGAKMFPSWKTGLSRDPYSIEQDRLLEIEGDVFLVGIKWEPRPVAENDWAKFMQAERDEGRHGSFEENVVTLVGDLRQVANHEHSLRDWSRSWRVGGKAVVSGEQIEAFIASDDFAEVPFVYIWSRIHASTMADPKRQFKDSDRYDATILAQVVPYSDIVVTDSYMATVLAQRGIAKTFDTRVFGAGTRQLADLVSVIPSAQLLRQAVTDPEK